MIALIVATEAVNLSLFLRDEAQARRMIPLSGGKTANNGVEIPFPEAFGGKIVPFAQPAIQHILRWQELNEPLFQRQSARG